MAFFHNFTTPLWEIFAGNLLLLACSLFYLTWWIVAFKPGPQSGTEGNLFISIAFVTGISGIVLMVAGINFLHHESRGVPVKAILMGIAVLYVVLLLLTTIFYKRIVTSELMIIHIWAALELSAVAALYGAGRFGFGTAVFIASLIAIAIVAGLICYVLYYRLSGVASYWDGMIPLAVDALVMAIFLVLFAFS